MPPLIRDISGWIYNGMWSYCPEYPGAEIHDLPHPDFLPQDYPVYLQGFTLGGQTGTYIETRAHVDSDAEPVTSLPLSEFYKPVIVLDAGLKEANQPVTLEDIRSASEQIQAGDAVLIRTGWDSMWDNTGFVEGSPYIERQAAVWLIEHKIGLLGADFPRFDRLPDMQFPWDKFWEMVNFVLAPVCNLDGLMGHVGYLTAFPLKIRGACSTPCRAAIIMDSSPGE